MTNEEPYASVAIIGRATPELWFYEPWMNIVSALNPLVAKFGQEVAVRTTQGDQNSQQLRFGKLGWNDQSHRKWTHQSPITSVASSGWTMMGGEV